MSADSQPFHDPSAPSLVGDVEMAWLLLSSIGGGIYGVDLQGNCTFANPACVRMLGFESDEELLGRNMHVLSHHTRPDGQPYPVEECRIYRAFRKREGVQVDDEMLWRADGSSFPAEYLSFPIEREGELVGCVVSFIDITDRREAERLLAEQAAALAEAARFPDMNPGPVLKVALDGGVVLANAAARELLSEEVVGECWPDMCTAIDEAAWVEILDSAAPVTLEARFGGCEYLFTHRRDVEGQLVFVYGADVTKQKHAERALLQSQKMATLGTLVAGIAHELNNPAAATRRASEQMLEAADRLERERARLSALRMGDEGWLTLSALTDRARDRAGRPSELRGLERSDREADVAQWLRARGIDDAGRLAPSLVGSGLDTDELGRLAGVFEGRALACALGLTAGVFLVHTLLREIGDASGRISEIVGALKSYSYLGQAPQQDVDLHEGLESTLVILRSKLRGITVTRHYSADLPPVPAHASELNQVWTNLLDNAAHALAGTGEIAIRTRRDGDWAIIEIEDDGPGIPDDVQPQVFDAFFTTKPPGEGTGFGLSTSYGIVVDKHGGTISLASRPGLTSFTVRLPIVAPALEGLAA